MVIATNIYKYDDAELNTLHEIFMNLEYSMECNELNEELTTMIEDLWKLANRTTMKVNDLVGLEIEEPYDPI